MLHPKYIFISGGVISGIGKGTVAASIAFLLKSAGYKVVPLKFENYLNIDAGTINPIEHGDPFLCEDGAETDMDIGSYEKLLDQNMGKSNFVTMGQIYLSVIERERRFEYHGEDVEAIPHITNEILSRISLLTHDADIVIVELGGTAGEYQNVFYYEASRILTLRNPSDVIHIHVSYVPTPEHLGEPKTKPTQLSVRTLNALGIQPNFIVARSKLPLDERRRSRLALFCNVHNDDIITNPYVKSIYELPLLFSKQKFEQKILKKLSLPQKKPNLSVWNKFVENIKDINKQLLNIVIVGKYFGTGEYQLRDSYAALFDALDHAALQHKIAIKTRWVDAEKIEEKGTDSISKPDGIIVPIGWGNRGAEGMIKAASYARINKIPYLGLCYGMQLAAIAFARDVLGWNSANTTENNRKTKYPVIHLMPHQKKFMKKRAYGGTMRLGAWNAHVIKNTMTHEIYKKYQGFIDQKSGLTSERHRHRYEFNNRYASQFERHGFVVSARSVREGLVEIMELKRSLHPFYLGTQGHPEYKSRPLRPHPIFSGFIEACKKEKDMVQ